MGYGNTGNKQSAEHLERRMAAMRKRREETGKWPGGSPPSHTPETLWKLVNKRAGEGACWPWTGYRGKDGYGRVWLGGRGYYAHRVVFDLKNPGVIDINVKKSEPEWKAVRHTCDNPRCCNPEHLLLGTMADNMADKVARGRSNIWAAGSLTTPRAKLSGDDVRAIREAVRVRRATGVGMMDKELATQYGISVCSVKSAVSGRTYKDVI